MSTLEVFWCNNLYNVFNKQNDIINKLGVDQVEISVK